MELKRNLTYLSAFCLSVLVLCPLVEGGCMEDMMKNPGANECMTTFMAFFMNIGASVPTDGNDGDAVIKALCSEEGKSAFSCLTGYMKDCPEMFSGGEGGMNPLSSLGQIEGFDMSTFMQEGALDATCALLVGPCSKVKECFPSTDVNRMKRQTSINKYLMFQSQAEMMCGPYKEQMDCMIKALADCPKSVVAQVEAQFEAALNMSTAGQTGTVVSYQDTKSFMQSQCSKLPSDDTCLKSVFITKNFTECNEDVSMKYSKDKSCSVHDMSTKCIKDFVEPKCGEQDADFLAHNVHMIYAGIPNDCYVSSSNIVQASFGLLLISAILSWIF